MFQDIVLPQRPSLGSLAHWLFKAGRYALICSLHFVQSPSTHVPAPNPPAPHNESSFKGGVGGGGCQ